jgi:pimeloyl-ACP methyl ester carboxylesterase
VSVDNAETCPTLLGRASLASQVALDEAVLAVIRNRQPKPHMLVAADRTATELIAASAVFAEQGWLATPPAYHREPPPLRDAEIIDLRARSWPYSHETMTFASEFRPRGIEPGAERWVRNGRNGTVLVRLLRHRDAAAPWVVCLHGFGMGASRFDLTVLWAKHLHRQFGFNVAVPVLPRHGPRRTRGDGQLLSLDLVGTLHGISQAIWDVRRLVSWIRGTGGASVGVYGLSLGGYLAALLAGIERLDSVVAGIPFTDVAGLMLHHRPPTTYADILRSASARDVFSVVSPVGVRPLLGPDRLAIFAARGDRLIPGEQPLALRETWQACPIHWYNGGHTGFAWSREARDFVGNRLRAAL